MDTSTENAVKRWPRENLSEKKDRPNRSDVMIDYACGKLSHHTLIDIQKVKR